MSEKQASHPYILLGIHLKKLRERQQKTLAEVSGAVEIDIDMLTQIEDGKTRPAEDILLLLISHFDIKDDEADALLDLAGYEKPKGNDTSVETSLQKQLMVLLPLDNRILFSDDAHINGNKDSLVLNFMQTDLLSNQSTPVARVGMSLPQAQKLFDLLRQALYYQAQPKALPAPKSKPDQRSSK
ncbi:MAG: hypothetical protein JWS12_483 [Candidatus Saccharibacteria bacterium]|nr:hypothetical protein [Candidatus Saccharibacteria bacterium]